MKLFLLIIVFIAIILSTSYTIWNNTAKKKDSDMKTERIFLQGSCGSHRFTIDTAFNVHCDDARVRSIIQKLLKKFRDEFDKTLPSEYWCIGYEFISMKNSLIHTESYTLYDAYKKEHSSSAILTVVNSPIGDTPKPFLEGKYLCYLFTVDTDLKITSITDTEEEGISVIDDEFPKFMIQADLDDASDMAFGYFPDQHARIVDGLLRGGRVVLKKVYSYYNVNNEPDDDPNVKY